MYIDTNEAKDNADSEVGTFLQVMRDASTHVSLKCDALSYITLIYLKVNLTRYILYLPTRRFCIELSSEGARTTISVN